MSSVPLMTLHNSNRSSNDVRDHDQPSEEDEDDPLESVLSKMKYRSSYRSQDFWSGLLFVGITGFALGFLVSYVTLLSLDRSRATYQPAIPDVDLLLASESVTTISMENLNGYFRNLSAVPPGNRSRNLMQAQILQKHFQDCEFDIVSPIHSSSLLLSYGHNQPDSNSVSIVHTGEVERITATYNAILETMPPNEAGYLVSNEISVSMECVRWATSDLDSDCRCKGGTILITSADNTSVMDVVDSALRKHVIGVILYSNDDVPIISPLQLGVMQYLYGNPSASSENSENEHHAPAPVLVIRRIDADQIMQNIKNPGPNKLLNMNLEMKINFVNIKKTFHNVMAAIRGTVEPDRYVMLGTSRETYPNTEHLWGTSAMMELAKNLHVLKRSKNWKPRRSIVFSNWGLSPVNGHYNSSLFSANWEHPFEGKLVTYIELNIPSAEIKNLFVFSSPLLTTAVRSALLSLSVKIVAHEEIRWDGSDSGLNHLQLKDDNSVIRNLNNQGVPTVVLEYQPSTKDSSSSEALNTKNVDWDVYQTSIQLWRKLAFEMSDFQKLPLNVSYYALTLNYSLSHLMVKLKDIYPDSFNNLKLSLQEFVTAATGFDKEITEIGHSDGLKMRMMNDQLLAVEKAFFHYHEASDQTADSRNDMESTSFHTSGFDQMHELFHKLNAAADNSSRAKNYFSKQEIISLAHCVRQATLVLTDSLQTLVTKG